MKFSIIIALFLGASTCSAQVVQFGATQYLRKFDYSRVEGFKGYLRPVVKDIQTSSQSLDVDILIWKYLYLNTGYIWGSSYCGFIAEHPSGIGLAGQSTGTLWHHQVPIRLRVQYSIYTRWNRSIWIAAVAGVSINMNRGFGIPDWSNGQTSWSSLPYTEHKRLFLKYNYNSSFHKTFLLYRADLEAGVDVMPWLALFFRMGASLGFQKQAEHIIDYQFENEALLQGTMITKGNSRYYGLGCSFKIMPQKKTWKEVLKKKE